MSETGFNIGHTDKMAVALVDILSADETLAEWTGGQIHRTQITGPIPGVRPPSISVAVLSDESSFATSGRDELQTPLGMFVQWPVAQRILKPGEVSAGGVVDHIKGLLMTNRRYFLAAERFANERLAERLNGFLLTDYTGIFTGDDSVIQLLLVADYRSDLNSQTRQRWAANA